MNSLYWIEELLPDGIISKKMPDGVGYFIGDKFVLLLSEESKTTLHKGINYPFQLFFGVFFPIVKLKHNAVIAKFQFLENHPVKKEWLYIPAENENFEDEVRMVLREVFRGSPLFGIPVKETAAEKRARESAEEIPDMRKPSLFNTDAPKALKKVAKPEPKPKVAKPVKKAKASQKAVNEYLLNLAKRRS